MPPSSHGFVYFASPHHAVHEPAGWLSASEAPEAPADGGTAEAVALPGGVSSLQHWLDLNG